MLVKRLVLVAISVAIGFALTWFVITVDVQIGPINLVIAGTTLEQYGFWYTAFTTLALSCAIGIWLDKFMKTEILPK